MAAPLGPPPRCAAISSSPSGATRTSRPVAISTTSTPPSGSATGPSGNPNPRAITRPSSFGIAFSPIVLACAAAPLSLLRQIDISVYDLDHRGIVAAGPPIVGSRRIVALRELRDTRRDSHLPGQLEQVADVLEHVLGRKGFFRKLPRKHRLAGVVAQ